MTILEVSNNKLVDTIKSYLRNGESIILNTQIFPIDSKIDNYLSTQIYVSNTKLFIYFDNQLEIYDLMNTKIESNGVSPNFELQSILFEGSYNLINDINETRNRLKENDDIFKFSIYQESTMPRTIYHRKDFKISRSYQNWALYQILKSVQQTGTFNPILLEILNNKYLEYNSKFLFTILSIGVTFVIVRVLLLLINLGYFESLIDLIFIIITLLQGIKVLKQYRNKLVQYKRIYLSYV